MSEFLQKHRKKGILAALLLFLKRGKGVWAILAMVGLLGGIFIAPSGSFFSLPWLQTGLQRMGLGGLAGGRARQSADKGEMDRNLDSARSRAALNLVSSNVGERGSSLMYIKGDKNLLEKEPETAGLADSIKQKGGKTVGGIINPEDSVKNDKGVMVDEDELRGGLMNAYAGVVPGGPGISGGPGASSGSGAAEALGVTGGSGYLSASNSGLDMVKNTLGNERVPVLGGRTFEGAAGGKVGWQKGKNLHASSSRAAGLQRSGPGSVMYQLAEGRAYSISAAPPPGYCDPGSCPAEYASNASGAVFDGGKPGGQLLTATQLGEAPSPVTPNDTQAQSLIEEAVNLENDMKNCETVMNQEGPAMRKDMYEIQRISDELTQTMKCNQGGCSKSKAEACRKKGNEMKPHCNDYNIRVQTIANACHNSPVKMKCDQ